MNHVRNRYVEVLVRNQPLTHSDESEGARNAAAASDMHSICYTLYNLQVSLSRLSAQA